MSDRLSLLADKLQSLPTLLTQALEDLVDLNKDYFEQANTNELATGKRADGTTITPAYTSATRSRKAKLGLDPSTVTLKDSGDFYRGLVARVRGEAVELVGTDEKTQELQQHYGRAIVGLSDEAVDSFREELVRPELHYKTREILGL